MYIEPQMEQSASTAHTSKTLHTQPFWIGDKYIEPGLNQITCEGKATQIEHQSMRVLEYLASNSGQAVSREEILEIVWAGTSPNDEGLTQAISKLRTVLGDNAKEAKYIQTIRKIGYRLIAPVSYSSTPSEEAIVWDLAKGSNRIPTKSIRIRINAGWVLAAAMVFLTLFVIALF